MKTIPRLFILSLYFLLPFAHADAQSTTSKGTEFWTLWMNHISGATGNNASQMSLYITSDITTTGKVELADGTSTQNFTVTANQVTVIDVPSSAYVGTEGTFNKGIHITAAKPIAVYAHIYAQSVSGATLLIPVNTMGKNYYSINYTQLSNQANSYSSFAVIATEDNTTVDITPSAALLSGKPANTMFTITLNKGQVYQGLAYTDLTGTLIKSVSANGVGCKKIAVFSGSGKIGIGCDPALNNDFSSDNLFQQVYPTASWGKNYITAPLKSRSYDVYRIVLSEDNTNVTLNGTPVPAASFTNKYYEFTSTQANVIAADKPIQVVQYAVTQGKTLNCVKNTSDVGDPEMIYITPIEQSLDHVTLYSTNKYLITKNFINVIIPTASASSFTLDGAAPAVSFTPVAGNTQYAYAQIPVNSGTHNIKAAAGFNAIAYGFGNAESYGYAAGTNLQNLNEYLSLKNTSTNATSANGCKGDTYNLQVTLPYQTSSIKWDLKDGSAAVTQTNPTVDETIVKNGQTLYIYKYASPITYTIPGSYSVVATVFNPQADDCGSNEDIEFDFDVSDIPVAAFSTAASACPKEVVSFTDQTNTNGVNTKTRAWDFGDATNATAANPNTANSQNPTHFYTQSGDYTVTLTITNDNNCSSVIQHNIHINTLPQASFTTTTPTCDSKAITFTDTSVPGDGANSQWAWNFGDATNSLPDNPNTAATKNAQHTYLTPGTYTASLIVTSNTGCASVAATKTIVIQATPVAAFNLPDACVNDNTKFTNNTAISDGSDAQLTYVWSFDDPASGAANTSTLKNPQHHFSHAGNFIITLTATSASGCVNSLSQNFTVNGDTPQADFEVLNANALCSANDVVFHNKSTVNFGNVTKLVWYFDVDNHPTESVTYTRNEFTATNNYTHNYGLLLTAQQFHVKLLAFSGDACQSYEKTATITVNPSPTVAVTPIGPLCLEDSPVQINAQPANGVTGTSAFSGTGVSTSGMFNPSVSGPGAFNINYTFIAANGCDYTTTIPVVVHATPSITVTPEVRILDGGEVKLTALATGVGPLSYKWTLANGNTATGIDHDNIAEPTASPQEDVSYMLTVTSAENCSKSAIVKVIVLKAPSVPNAFTPNGDGINDKWEIKYLDSYPNCTIDIYNRYGERLYSSVGYSIPWDGTFRGSLLPTGTYYYIINPKNGRKVISGSVTIIR